MADLKKKGDKKFGKGMDLITTGLFNWSKDYVSAATEFEEALGLYKQAQAFPDCLKTLQQLMICNEKNRDAWAVARNFESMMEIYTEKKVAIADEQYLKLTHDTFVAFRMASSTDKGLKVIKNSAKYLIARGKQDVAINLLQECYQESLSDEKCYGQEDIFLTMIEVMLEVEAYPKIIELYKQKIAANKTGSKANVQQFALIVVILSIIQRNIKQAEDDNMKFMAELPSYAYSSECESATNLIQAYSECNAEKFKKETTRASRNSEATQIIKKLRELKLLAPVIKQGQDPSKPGESAEGVQQKKMLEALFF